MNHHGRKLGNHVPEERFKAEQKVGITERTSPIDFGWSGEMRKRYTDFLVYEVKKDGTVIHLTDFEEPKPKVPQKPKEPAAEQSASTTDAQVSNAPEDKPAPDAPAVPEVKVQEVSDADRQTLNNIFGTTVADQLIAFDTAMQLGTHDKKTPPMKLGNFERSQRGRIHGEIRRIFSGRVDTTTDGEGNITGVPFKPYMSDNWRKGGQAQGGRKVSKAVPRVNDGTRNGNGQKSFSELGGDYLHCTLYKENKDTMDATNMIARFLKVKTSAFGFSGTKDRRAATVQRISIQRQRASNLIWLNSRLQGIRLGDFKHSKHPIQLGQHGGNEFVITMKHVQHIRGANQSISTLVKTIEESVETGLRFVHENGFLNYFGLQRFGTHSIGTQELGAKILRGDFESVIDDILNISDDLAQALDSSDQDALQGYQQDDINRAKGIALWHTTQNAKAAIQLIPRRYSAESRIIEHLSNQKRDFMGAILSITRGLRQMYIHGYQSLVWNHVASLRWAKYGSKVIVGDLIMLDTKPKPPRPDDCDDDDIPDPSGEWEDFYANVRHLTAEDVASGKYTIFDIVLPQPGYDVIYPKNDIGAAYAKFMATKEGGELDPYNMRRPQREFSLSGGYRNLIGRFMATPEYLVRTYSNDEEQMYPTDLDLVLEKKAREQAETKDLKRRRSDAELAPASSGPAVEEAAVAAKRTKMEAPASASLAAAAANEASPRSAFLLAKLHQFAEEAGAELPPAAGEASASFSTGGAPAAVPVDGSASFPAAVAAPPLRQISGNTATKFAPGRYNWEEVGSGDKVAVILKFQLQSSSYATVVLRELQTALAGERNPICE